MGYKIYCIKKFSIGIRFIKKILEINKIENKLPKTKKDKFFLSRLFVNKRQMKIKIRNNINKYGDGICFEKKEKIRKMGVKNKKMFFFF